jgi:glucose-1-phosphate thymidylyltransferase
MKGLILSGGAGTRLRPITHTSAKQLVPVANKPILFYWIEYMVEAGIKEIGIIVGDTADEIMAAAEDGSRWGVEITYLRQDAPLGLAHCVLIARDFLGDDDFVMYLGDNMLQQGLKEFVDAFEAERALGPGADGRVLSSQILLAHVDDPRQSGVAVLGPTAKWSSWWRSPPTRPPTSPRRRVPVRSQYTARCAIEPLYRGSWNHRRHRGWSTTAMGARDRSWGIDTGRRIRCSRATASCSRPGARRGSSGRKDRVEGRAVVEAGVRSWLDGAGSAHRRGTRRQQLHRPFTSVAATAILDLRSSNSCWPQPVSAVLLTDSSSDATSRSCSGDSVATRLLVGDHSRVDA